jgi:hypothetical protein
MMTGTGQMICLKPMMRQAPYFFERMERFYDI